MQQDEEHLNLLAIFYYVLAGITALFSCFPVVHLIFGALLLIAPEQFNGPDGPGEEFPNEIAAAMFIIIPSFFILCGWAIAFCMFLTGRYISRRANWMFCMVASAISCAFVPLGTVWGVFSIIVLNRPSVRELFDGANVREITETTQNRSEFSS